MAPAWSDCQHVDHSSGGLLHKGVQGNLDPVVRVLAPDIQEAGSRLLGEGLGHGFRFESVGQVLADQLDEVVIPLGKGKGPAGVLELEEVVNVAFEAIFGFLGEENGVGVFFGENDFVALIDTRHHKGLLILRVLQATRSEYRLSTIAGHGNGNKPVHIPLG